MPCVPTAAESTIARTQSARMSRVVMDEGADADTRLPAHGLAAFEIALDIRAGEPHRLQLLFSEELQLIADVRRAGLRPVAVAHERPRAHGGAELDRGHVTVAARRAHFSVLVLG